MMKEIIKYLLRFYLIVAFFICSFEYMGVYDNNNTSMLGALFIGLLIGMASSGILSLTKYDLNATP